MTEATPATAMTLNHSENLTKQVEKRLVEMFLQTLSC